MYLTAKELSTLHQYEYKAGLYGYLDRIIMTPFWNFIVTFLPLWLAPNVVTLTALIHLFLCHCIFSYYSPTFQEPMPSWCNWFAIYALFMYQTLDAIDGKQARRTNSSSLLGQLFDHGCDALACLFLSSSICSSVALGPSLFSYIVLLLHIVPFYFANFEHCHTGVMRFGAIGVTEAQFAAMFLFLLSALFGQHFWTISIVSTFQIKHIFVAFVTYGSISSAFENLYFVYTWKHSYNSSNALRQIAQFLFLITLAFVWFGTSDVLLYAPRSALGSIGLTFCFLVTRLLITSVTKGEYFLFYPILYPLLFVCILCVWFPALSTLTVYIYFFYCIALYSHYVISSIWEIAQELKIHPFRISTTTKKD